MVVSFNKIGYFTLSKFIDFHPKLIEKGITYMKKLIFAIAAIMISGSALATPSTATLVNANGSVMVNQGKQFVSAQSGLLLSTGDRVMVMEGANASVRYNEGCVVNLASGTLVTVATQEACVAGNNFISQSAPVTAEVVGKGESYTAYWAAGAAVVLVCVLAICIDNSNNKNVTSP